MDRTLFGEIERGDREARNCSLARRGRALVSAVGLLMFGAVAQAAVEGLPPDVLKSIREEIGDSIQGTRYLSADIDLNADHRSELILYLVGPMVCGTGGCPTLVFTPEGDHHRLVSSISVTRPPIRAAAVNTNGWRNLIVHIAGGGGPSKNVELLFDGRSYPENPTVSSPHIQAAKLAGSQLLIPDFDAFEDAKPFPGDGGTSDSGLGSGTQPSFDCGKATLAAEKLVCGDPELASADRALAMAFATGMKQWPAEDQTRERAAQRRWLMERNACAKGPNAKDCVRLSYQRRLIELQIRNGELEAPHPVSYRCKGHEDEPFQVSFYQQTDPPSAVLTFGDRQEIVFATQSGSGARYSNARVDFWEHHGAAAVTWSGESYTCDAP